MCAFLAAVHLNAGFAASPTSAVPVSDGIMLPRNRANLSIPVEARVRELRVEEGQTVHKGDILAILYTESEELACERAAAQLKRAEVIHRSKLKLKETNGVAELDLIGAEVDLELAKIELRRSRAELSDKTLTAPWDGQVLRLLKSAGETANRGEKIIELIDYSTIYIDVYLDAQYLNVVRPGQRANISGDAVGPLPALATALMVDPVVEPGSGLTRVRLQMPNADLRIPTGLPVKVAFAVDETAKTAGSESR
ncbi:MAG: hypothetical protein JWL90_903 [Chthoniobacteraceae bacterium]|nr:hypothetical protein [Chthoniobacteraceae bacterium]